MHLKEMNKRNERRLQREEERKRKLDKELKRKKWLIEWRKGPKVGRNLSCENCLYHVGLFRCYMNLSWRYETCMKYGTCCIPMK